MSLVKAVMSVADAMDASADKLNYEGALAMRSFARELRTAVTASESEVKHRREPEPAQKPLRYNDAQVLGEVGAEQSVFLVGGASDGDMWMIRSDMPIGAKTLVSGEVYVRNAGSELTYSEEDTIKYRGQ